MKFCCSTFRGQIGKWVAYDPLYRQYYLQQTIENGPFVDSFNRFSSKEKEKCDYEEMKVNKFYTKGEIKKWGIKQILLNINSVILDFCPWCGEKLPPVLNDDYHCALFMIWGNIWKNKYHWWCRSRWNEISLYGPRNPFPRGFPKEFKSDAWWKNRGMETMDGLKNWRCNFNEWLKHNPGAQTYCSFLKENV